MPPSEIDQIFASKGKLTIPAQPSSSSQTEKKKKKKKNGAKRKREIDAEDDAHIKHPTKRRAPETVFDPSVHLPAAAAPKKSQVKSRESAGSLVRKKHESEAEEEERFRDSRGTGPRRKTEEGFAIYKEDELGITDQGGDTPLCPFDCKCCF